MGLIKLRPSDVERWSRCTASPFYCLDAPQTKKETYTEEGINAHSVFEKVGLARFGQDQTEALFAEDFLESDDDGMAEHVNNAIQHLETLIPFGWTTYFEKKVPIDFILPGQKGVADVVAHNPEMTEFIFADFKFGKGVLVEARNNREVLLHAAGFLNHLHLQGNLKTRKIKKIIIVILQPRRSHYPLWEIDYATLEKEIRYIADRAKEALSGEGKFFPHPESCRFCPMKNACRARKEKVFDLVSSGTDAFGSMSFKKPDSMTVEELAEVWHWLDFISSWPNSIREYMNEAALAGTKFPGLELKEPTLGDRQFINNQMAIKMCRKLGLEPVEYQKIELETPARLEKLLGKNIFAKNFQKLLHRKKNKPKLGIEGSGKKLNELRDEFEDLD